MALAVMRRHRRWLFVFLWLVIAAFIILYIPAFRAADTGIPGEAIGKVGDLPITAAEFQKVYSGSARCTSGCIRGAWTWRPPQPRLGDGLIAS
jgi:hypothetical protein